MSALKLYQLGCGNAMVQSSIDRGNIHAAISNTKMYFQHFKRYIKTGICTREQALESFLPQYDKLLSVEHLVNIYHELYMEEYSKLKLQIEKSIN